MALTGALLSLLFETYKGRIMSKDKHFGFLLCGVNIDSLEWSGTRSVGIKLLATNLEALCGKLAWFGHTYRLQLGSQ